MPSSGVTSLSDQLAADLYAYIKTFKLTQPALRDIPLLNPYAFFWRRLPRIRVMPIGFAIYREHRLLFIRGHGVITQTERIETMLAWLRDPGYQHCIDALFDATAAQSTPRLAELREIIAILRQHMPVRGPPKLAIVTAQPITYAVARVFQELIQPNDVPLEVRVFFDRELAWAWLRPDEPLPEPK